MSSVKALNNLQQNARLENPQPSRNGTRYRIDTNRCIGCQGCRSVCPAGCISKTVPRVIDESSCLQCGSCFRICPVKAVKKLG